MYVIKWCVCRCLQRRWVWRLAGTAISLWLPTGTVPVTEPRPAPVRAHFTKTSTQVSGLQEPLPSLLGVSIYSYLFFILVKSVYLKTCLWLLLMLLCWQRLSWWSWGSTASRGGSPLRFGQFSAHRQWCAQLSGRLQQSKKPLSSTGVFFPSCTSVLVLGFLLFWQALFLHLSWSWHVPARSQAKLPRGIHQVRPHLKNIDNVPLLVPLFTDCSPDSE